MPWQNIQFGPDGQNNGVSAVLTQIQGGKFYSIYPFESGGARARLPLPALGRALADRA